MNSFSASTDLLLAIHGKNPFEGFPANEYPFDPQGWHSSGPIFARLMDQIRPRLIIEVGSWKGASALHMAQLARQRELPVQILCVDTWLGNLEAMDAGPMNSGLAPRFGYPTLYYQFLANVVHAGFAETIVPLPTTSLLAARWLTKRKVQADLIYLDGSHEEDDVAADLRAYWPLVRPGGLMFGDDFLEDQWPGVVSAVRRFATERRLALTVARPHWVLRPSTAPSRTPPRAQFSIAKRGRTTNPRLLAMEKDLRQRVSETPESAESHARLGSLLQAIGDFTEAERSFIAALDRDRSNPLVLNDLGCVQVATDKLTDAEANFRRAIQLRPDFASAYNNLGSVLQAQGNLEAAVDVYRQAVAAKPDHPDALNNLGCALRASGKVSESIEHFQDALRLRPDFIDANLNLGGVLEELGRFDEAIACHQSAIHADPKRSDSHCRLASSLQRLGHFDQAIASYDQALQLDGQNADARFNRSLIFLATARFKEGWSDYAWRTRCQPQLARKLKQPEWTGESLEGRSILLHAEQGLGDTLQFIRYERLVRDRNPKSLWIEVQRPLIPLLRNSGYQNLVAAGEALPEVDVQASLLELPRIFDTTLDVLPISTAYIRPHDELMDHWAKRLKEVAGLKIGIGWQGNPEFADDRLRSAPLAEYRAIAAMQGVRLISLQKGPGVEQLAKLRERWRIVDFAEALDGEHGAFMDTAAILPHLDLVITTDTALAHLAGAMGVPVWLALSSAPEWRWLTGRDDSPWYPTMRLFRQQHWGDWAGVFRRMAEELLRLQTVHQASNNGTTHPVDSDSLAQSATPAAVRIVPPEIQKRANSLYREGLAAQRRGDHRAAVSVFEEALKLVPDHYQILNDLGCALANLNQHALAMRCFERSVQQKPDFADAHNNLGCTLRAVNKFAEAEVCLRRAVELKPEFLDAINNLGNTLQDLDRIEESAEMHQRVLAVRPNHAEAFNGLGAARQRQGRYDEAVEAFDRAIELHPGHAEAHFSRGLIRLSRGEFEEGWSQYDWRFKSRRYQARFTDKPLWDGQAMPSLRLLIHAEQGFGDTMQFIRLLPLAMERFGGNVACEVQGALLPLLEDSGFSRLWGRGQTLPDFDVQIPLLSLPRVLGIRVCDLPVSEGYLHAQLRLMEYWGNWLAQNAKPKRIGISWQGSPTYKEDRHRSLPLAAFQGLSTLPEFQLVNLQKGPGEEQVSKVPFCDKILSLGAWDTTNGAFVDTAAVIKNLDAVVTSDTAIAHLAGALGVPTHVVLGTNPEWRWMLDRADSPWYPSMRLYRRGADEEFSAVLRRVVNDLVS